MVKEAQLREDGEILPMEAFLPLRRENSAVRLCFDLIEYCIGADLPEDVFDDLAFQEIYWSAVDLVCWANVSRKHRLHGRSVLMASLGKDVYSYDMEQSRGIAGNNIVTVLMKERNITLQEAADYVGVHFEELMGRYISAQSRLPSWGSSVDSEVARYIQGLGCWIKGNLEFVSLLENACLLLLMPFIFSWSFETQRYFGSRYLEVKNTHLVTLRPREGPEELDSESDFE